MTTVWEQESAEAILKSRSQIRICVSCGTAKDNLTVEFVPHSWWLRQSGNSETCKKGRQYQYGGNVSVHLGTLVERPYRLSEVIHGRQGRRRATSAAADGE
jgi:hypothetical protein